jgi:TPR repeat protein
VPINLATAKSWFQRAAAQGHVDAETTLGLLLFQNGDQAEGLKWLKQAAEKGEPRALLVYGTALVNGDGVTQDPVLGYAYVSRAAAQGLPPAKDTLRQLDQLLPLADRTRAAGIARQLAKAAPASAAAKPAAKPHASAARPAKSPPPSSGPAKAVASAPPAAKPEPANEGAHPVGAWRIQLGAFAKRANAEALYAKLSSDAALAGRSPFYVAAGAVTRLQVGPFASKAAAEAVCKRLGVACFAVPAR